jgi:spermidine/putrescine transport system ATP-binding protein
MGNLQSGAGTEVERPETPAGDVRGTEGRPTVRLERVSKHFGDLVAVRELDLDIGRGEFFTLLGPSGCGKTTTLRMIAGFEQPTSGRIKIEGADVADLPAHKRPTNTVFQSYALFPHLCVEAELERVGLAAEVNRRPNQLSGGQQQRVALARALVNLPKVLLLDEPLGALDLKLRKGLQVELKRIQRDVGITFVYVTHDQEEALTMSDRIAVMSNGVVEQVDTPENVYERPRTTFVAGFIGVSNLMPGTVTTAGGGRGTIELDTGIEVEASVDGIQSGERCHAVVRPEKLRISQASGASPDGLPGVDGVVQSSIYLGTATQIVVGLPGDVSMTVLVPNASEAERSRLPGGGAPVRLSWEPEHMHVVRESEIRRADVEETVPA